jgi:hypothetical protein
MVGDAEMGQRIQENQNIFCVFQPCFIGGRGWMAEIKMGRVFHVLIEAQACTKPAGLHR